MAYYKIKDSDKDETTCIIRGISGWDTIRQYLEINVEDFDASDFHPNSKIWSFGEARSCTAMNQDLRCISALFHSSDANHSFAEDEDDEDEDDDEEDEEDDDYEDNNYYNEDENWFDIIDDEENIL